MSKRHLAWVERAECGRVAGAVDADSDLARFVAREPSACCSRCWSAGMAAVQLLQRCANGWAVLRGTIASLLFQRGYLVKHHDDPFAGPAYELADKGRAVLDAAK